jgi:hypothetical protein
VAGDRLARAYQRGCSERSEVNCAELAAVLVTIVVGSLNQLGLTRGSSVPRPSP